MKKQKTLGLTPRGYQLIKLLADKNRRKLSTQIELLAEEECKRTQLKMPAEIFKG